MRIPVHRSVLIYTGCSPCRPCPCFLVPHVMFAARCPTWSLRSLNTKKTSHYVYLCVCLLPRGAESRNSTRPIKKTHQEDPSRPIKTPSPGNPLFYFPISFTANIFPMWSLWSGHVGMSSLASACWPSWLSPGRANAAGLAPASTVIIREVSRNECVDLDSEKEGPIQSTHPKTSVPDHPRNKRLSNVADCGSFISF